MGAVQAAKDFAPDLTIAADKGIENALAARIPIDRILGDFDSIDPEALREVRNQHLPETEFPPEKDYTDTELALAMAMDEAGPEGEILILGASGSRLDHTMANVFLLKQPVDRGITCTLQDDHDRILLLKGPTRITIPYDPEWPYVSLLPLFGKAEGVSLQGFYYPLDTITLEPGVSLGVSNQLTEEKGTIHVASGYLLLIRTRD